MRDLFELAMSKVETMIEMSVNECDGYVEGRDDDRNECKRVRRSEIRATSSTLAMSKLRSVELELKD